MKIKASEAVDNFQKSYKFRSALEKNPDLTQVELLMLFWEWIVENGYLATELYN